MGASSWLFTLHLGHEGRWGRKVSLVPQDHLAPKDHQGSLARPDRSGHKVRRDPSPAMPVRFFRLLIAISVCCGLAGGCVSALLMHGPGGSNGPQAAHGSHGAPGADGAWACRGSLGRQVRADPPVST